ncbi:MAG: amino acid ABC transporter ATP-binding protein [candidate division Zixibacteria bacterium]|nr:amino acid ABC transporter ATP-binding protein [candidate division Zixibacteria bacterium]
MEPLLELKNISGRNLKNVSFSIFPSEKIVILGPSGCGKTTLLRYINMLVEPEEGQILFQSESVVEEKYPLLRRNVILLPQVPVTIEGTVIENLEWAHSFNPGEKQNSLECLRVVGIDHLHDDPAGQLSIGEKQRLNLAMGFSLKPKIMLLDEPTSALDPDSAEGIHQVIGRLNAKGVSFLIVTHNFIEARKLADKIGIMLKGQLRQLGRLEDVINNPIDNETANFLESHRKRND